MIKSGDAFGPVAASSHIGTAMHSALGSVRGLIRAPETMRRTVVHNL